MKSTSGLGVGVSAPPTQALSLIPSTCRDRTQLYHTPFLSDKSKEDTCGLSLLSQKGQQPEG